MRHRRTNAPPKRRERVNREITAPKVRLIHTKEGDAVVSLKEALKRAEAEGLDLVEIVPNANPPVCKIIDYGKYAYQKDKKKKEAKKHQRVMHLKEIKMRPKTDVHDYNFKVKHVRQFIEAGDRVKITIRFKGREMAFLGAGRKQLDKVIADTQDLAKIESMPKVEDRNMIMVLVPLKDKKDKPAKPIAEKAKNNSNRNKDITNAKIKNPSRD